MSACDKGQWLELLNIQRSSLARFWRDDCDISDVKQSRVIDQDVMRTRAEVDFFRSEAIRDFMRLVLLRYCKHYHVTYMQGLNEILAPILMIGENEQEPEEHFDVSRLMPNLCIFENLVDRLCPVTFSTEGVLALQSQLANFHLLLHYFVPNLAVYLSREGLNVDVYAPSWFITMFARRNAIPIVLHLWRLLLRSDRPRLLLMLAVAVMKVHAQRLMRQPLERLPEAVVGFKFSSIDEVNELFVIAEELDDLVPLSCQAEINALGFDAAMADDERKARLELLMFRPCLTIVADDLARDLVGQSPSSENITASPRAKSIRYLILDCRIDPDSDWIIGGSLSLRPDVVEEISRVAQSQQLSKSNQPNLDAMTPTSAALLALLLSCIQDDIYFVVVGDDNNKQSIPSPMPTTPSLPSSTPRLLSPGSSPVPEVQFSGTKPATFSNPSSVGIVRPTPISVPSPAPASAPLPGSGLGPGIPAHSLSSSTSGTTSRSGASSPASSIESAISSNINMQLTVAMLLVDPESQDSTPKTPTVVKAKASLTESTDATNQRGKATTPPMSTPSSSSTGISSPQSPRKKKKLRSARRKKEMMLSSQPSRQLATALLILGFPRVSIVRGAALSDLSEVEAAFVSIAPTLQHGLMSETDGFSSLAYSLHRYGATLSAGVVNVHQDCLLAHKVRQFTESHPPRRSSKAVTPTSSNARTFFDRISASSSSSSAVSMAVSYPSGSVLDLEGILRRLSGLQEGFLESILTSPMHSSLVLHPPTAISLRSASEESSSSQTQRTRRSRSVSGGGGLVEELLSSLAAHSSTQSRITGKLILKHVRRSAYSMAPIADDMISLEKKMASLRSNLRAAALDSSAATKNFSPKSYFS